MLEPPVIGNCTLNAAVSTDRITRTARDGTGESVARGTRDTKSRAPSATTTMMYQRPRGGRSRSKAPSVYFWFRKPVSGAITSAKRKDQTIDGRLGAAHALEQMKR